jgi:GntR family transcriptional regulator
MERKKPVTIAFTLDSKSGVPFYRQVILQIEMAIADGRLAPGDQLPTVRSLAVDLQVNPNTVARAYQELEIREILETQQGTGTFVGTRKLRMSDVERERVLSVLAREFVTKASSYGFGVGELARHLKDLEKEER